LPPTTYSAWLPLLDRFAAGDDTVLLDMQRGTIEWSNVVAERILQQLAGALKQRLEVLTAGFQKRLDRSASQVEMRAALGWAQQQLTPLGVFCLLPALEPRVQTHLSEECKRWVDRTQSSLETSARAGAGDPSTLAMLVASGLRWPPPPPLDSSSASDGGNPASAKPSPGRRVLL